MYIKTIFTAVLFVFLPSCANAQTVLPGWPKHEIIDSLRAYHLNFREERHDDAPMKSSIIVDSFTYSDDHAALYIDMTGGDTVAMVTIVLPNKTGFDYAFLSAAKEKELGKGEVNSSGNDMGERWDLKDEVFSINFTEANSQIAIMRLGKREMTSVRPSAKGYDDDAVSAAYNAGDFKTVLKLSDSAAKAGNAQAQFVLGMLYVQGQGVEKDAAKAAELFGKAGDQGHPFAKFILSSMYRTGTGVAKDMNRSFQLLRESAESGFPVAQNALAREYYEGSDVEHDTAKALLLFQQAANAGISEAQFYIGYMMYRGEGTTKDVKLAVEWLERAVLQRNTRALGFLVPIYMGEEGVPKDLARAYAYSHLAAKYDPIQAMTSGSSITEKWATPEDVEAAKKIMADLEEKWKDL